MQSLIVAAIPNIFGWLAISIAKVSTDNMCSFLYQEKPCLVLSKKKNVVCYHECGFQEANFLLPNVKLYCLLLFLGLVASIYGKVVGRFWSGNNLLCGNLHFLYLYISSFIILSLIILYTLVLEELFYRKIKVVNLLEDYITQKNCSRSIVIC